MLKVLLLHLIATSYLCKASQQQEQPFSPRTVARIEEAKQELTEIIENLKRAYLAAKEKQSLITNDPRKWLFQKENNALQACLLQEKSSRTDLKDEELRRRKEFSNEK